MSQPSANSMNALTKRNEMVKEARTLGIDKPHTLKNDELEQAIEAKRAELAADKAKREAEGDPFDEIDPTVEGDHLDTDDLADQQAARDATREAWLLAAVEELRPLLKQVGAVVPERVSVSVGFAAKNVRKALGVCFPTAATNGGISHMFVSPMIEDPIKVLDVLVHELIHASDDCKSGHAGHFAKCARAIGLEGKLTATHAGDDLRTQLEDISTQLGPYPHTKLNLGNNIKKQTTRLLKLMCSDDCCPLMDEATGNVYTIRVTKKWIEVGLPSCPCGATMKPDAE
jgi:hypothetical protein